MSVAKLAERVGQELGVSPWRVIEQDRIDRFADATDDHQWIHVDPARAAGGPFGATVAHGFLTLSLLAPTAYEVLADAFAGATAFNYGLDKVRFIAPVKVGARVRNRIKLLAFEPKGEGRYLLTSENSFEIEGEAKPALIAVSLVMLLPDDPPRLMTELDPRLNAKRAGLRRMRWLATGLLLVMLVLLGLGLALRSRWPALDWLVAFAEAATVGAVADWFAVVALFRRPLGLPIPHTALIPRNKDRIGAELGRFIEQHFLTPENVTAKLAELDPIGRGARWLSLPANRRGVALRLREALPTLFAAFDDAEIERLIGSAVTRRLEALDLARVAGSALDFVTEHQRHQALLDHALVLIAGWLDRNRALILAKFGEQSSFTPRFVDGYIVKRFVDGMIDLIREVAETPHHEIRQRFDRTVREFVERLGSDPAFRAQAEALKLETLKLLAPEKFTASLWRELKRHLAGPDSPIEDQVDRALGHLARSLREDAEFKARVDRAVARVAGALTGRIRRQVGALIADVVRRWDFREVGDRLELEVGRDLQFIRLNGTLVGGLVGLVLHGLLRLVGAG